MLSKLMDLKTYKRLFKTYQILGFYSFVILIPTPLGYAWKEKSGIEYGIVVGLVISTCLWFQYGKKMI